MPSLSEKAVSGSQGSRPGQVTPLRGKYETVVLGGGPAGACAAGCLAVEGRPVLVLERARFPRFHVGESWLPLANPILRRLGLTPELDGMAKVSKFGATFCSVEGDRSARVDFRDAPDVPEPHSFHATRADFDALLLNQARELGAEVREGCVALEVDLENEPPRVLVQDDRGCREWIETELILDATGRRGLIAKQLNLRVVDPELRKTALFGHFEGVPHLGGAAEGDIRICCREAGGWVWLIPLAGGRMSIGFVFDSSERPKEIEESADVCLDRWVAQLPLLDGCRDSLRRVSPAIWEADFSYRTMSYSGDRWLLLGDAGSFLDPVFSSGGQMALQAGAEAADAVIGALGRGRRARHRVFGRYDRAQRRRYRFFRRLVVGFYRPAFQELMYQPETWPAGARALASMLAGQDCPRLTTRLRVVILFLIVNLKERLTSQYQ